MKMGLYVITHKEVENIYPKDRKIMLVGAKGKVVPNGYCSDYDETKDNISEKNKNYCELTGLYYFSKYDDSDILSLEHYRRLFLKTRLYLFKYPFLKQKDIEKLMKKYDIIVPRKVKLKKTIFEAYAHGNIGSGHIGSDMVQTKKIIEEKYPEYLPSFNEVMNGHKTYVFNMFIAKREIVKDYANWLFDILFELEKRIDLSGRDDYQKRVYGFLAERLFTVYLNYHKELKICEKPVVMIDVSPFQSQIRRIKNKLKKIFKLKDKK